MKFNLFGFNIDIYRDSWNQRKFSDPVIIAGNIMITREEWLKTPHRERADLTKAKLDSLRAGMTVCLQDMLRHQGWK